MKTLTAIARLLLFIALLGLGPAWAESCCCGTGDSVCKMGEEPADTRQTWLQGWLAVTEHPLFSEPSCTIGDNCGCLEPADAGHRLPPFALSEGWRPSAPIRLEMPPKMRVNAPERALVKTLPPLRPPIESVGWSYALFPLPPPSRV